MTENNSTSVTAAIEQSIRDDAAAASYRLLRDVQRDFRKPEPPYVRPALPDRPCYVIEHHFSAEAGGGVVGRCIGRQNGTECSYGFGHTNTLLNCKKHKFGMVTSDFDEVDIKEIDDVGEQDAALEDEEPDEPRDIQEIDMPVFIAEDTPDDLQRVLADEEGVVLVEAESADGEIELISAEAAGVEPPITNEEE